MKIQVRRNIFETNSSSLHAISIVKNSKVKNYPKEVVFDSGEFGWQPDTYYGTFSKACYLWEAILDYSYKEGNEYINEVKLVIEKITNILNKHGIKATFIYGNVEVVKKVWSDETEHLYVKFTDGKGNKDEGWLDHGCECHDLIDALIENEDLLLSFLFDENSYILTGNDNCSEDIPDFPNDGLDRFNYEKGN